MSSGRFLLDSDVVKCVKPKGPKGPLTSDWNYFVGLCQCGRMCTCEEQNCYTRYSGPKVCSCFVVTPVLCQRCYVQNQLVSAVDLQVMNLFPKRDNSSLTVHRMPFVLSLRM